jgi:hypothetical protein
MQAWHRAEMWLSQFQKAFRTGCANHEIQKSKMRNVTDKSEMSRHVTDNVTDDLEKNLGKTVFVTMSRLNTPGRGAPHFGLRF